MNYPVSKISNLFVGDLSAWAEQIIFHALKVVAIAYSSIFFQGSFGIKALKIKNY